MTTRFTAETRAETVRKATEGADIDALANELDIKPMMVRRWITMAKNAQRKKPPMKMSAGALGETETSSSKDDAVVAKLLAEIARLKKDKETLKTTLAMLIKDST